MSHFPIFLEYDVDDCEEYLIFGEELREKGISEKELEAMQKIPNEVRVRKEILYLMSSLTNFYFFDYNSVYGVWGIQCPNIDDEQTNSYKNRTSHCFIGCYTYPSFSSDLNISEFTQCSEYYKLTEDPLFYFKSDIKFENGLPVTLPFYLDFALERYYSLGVDTRKTVLQCLGLLNNGIELFANKSSISFLSIASSIEGMALLDLKKYGHEENLGAKKRFIRYLECYVAGKSGKKFKEYYEKRCNITHESCVFLSDYDLFGNIRQQDEDWVMRLELLQAARMAFFYWIRRKS